MFIPCDFENFAKSVCKKIIKLYPFLKRDLDEVLSICNFAIARCNYYYKPEKGVWWAAFVNKYGVFQAKRYLWEYGLLHKKDAPREEAHTDLVGANVDCSYSHQWMDEIEARDSVEFALSGVRPNYRKHVEMFYLEEYSQPAIASIEGLSSSSISKHVRKGVEEAREKLSNQKV